MAIDEKNRKIAELMGWTFQRIGPDLTLTRPSDKARYTILGPSSPEAELRFIAEHGPNYYRDETASASLLEKIRSAHHVNVSCSRHVKVCIKVIATGRRGGRSTLVYAEDPDRKTAIADAFLVWNGVTL